MSIRKNRLLKRNQKPPACSKGIPSRRLGAFFNLLSLTASRRQYQNKLRPSVPFPISLPKTIEYISSGANKQKIKIAAHSQCNVRASENAE